MWAVVTCLLAPGILPKAPTIPPDWEQEGLSYAAFDISYTDGTIDEPNLATTIALVENRKGKPRMLHHSPTPQESSQPPPTAPPEETPPSSPVAPPPRTWTRKPRDQGTPQHMFPTRKTATTAETALSQGEYQGPYPTIVQRTADLLRKPQELMARQREDCHLLGRVQDLDNGGTGGEYVADDDGILWYAPPGSILRLAILRSLVPGVLAFVHTTYGHPGVARTTDLKPRKYHRT